MSCLEWNCRGLGSPHAIHELKTFVKSCNPDFLFLMETRSIESCVCTLGFSHGCVVSRQGMGGGIALFWHDFLDVRLINYSTGHIDVFVSS